MMEVQASNRLVCWAADVSPRLAADRGLRVAGRQPCAYLHNYVMGLSSLNLYPEAHSFPGQRV